jgi:hypothetical protein
VVLRNACPEALLTLAAYRNSGDASPKIKIVMPNADAAGDGLADLTSSDANNDALHSVTSLIGDRCQVFSHSRRFVLQRHVRRVDAPCFESR